jgi:hypothetical protein
MLAFSHCKPRREESSDPKTLTEECTNSTIGRKERRARLGKSSKITASASAADKGVGKRVGPMCQGGGREWGEECWGEKRCVGVEKGGKRGRFC